MSTTNLVIPGSLLSVAFDTSQCKAINQYVGAALVANASGDRAYTDAAVAANSTADKAYTNSQITANNALYISKTLLKSTTAGAADFAAYQVAIAAIP